MKRLELSGKVARENGLVALVDDDFVVPLTLHGRPATYHAQSTGTYNCKKFYSVRSVTDDDGKHTKRYLHMDVLRQYDGDDPVVEKGVIEVDHIDKNSLNNCRSNLRIVSKSEQQRNVKRKICDKPLSGYSGVYIANCGIVAVKDYRGVRYRKCFRQSFSGLIAAAEQADKWELEFYGDEAVLNFERSRK